MCAIVLAAHPCDNPHSDLRAVLGFVDYPVSIQCFGIRRSSTAYMYERLFKTLCCSSSLQADANSDLPDMAQTLTQVPSGVWGGRCAGAKDGGWPGRGPSLFAVCAGWFPGTCWVWISKDVLLCFARAYERLLHSLSGVSRKNGVAQTSLHIL